MDSTKSGEFIPPRRRGANSYKPEDIRRWGIERFMNEVSPTESFPISDLGFTDAENRRMDQLLEEGREQKENDN
jgi:hypothetical protein